MIVKAVEIELDLHYINYLATNRGDKDTRSEVVMIMPRPSNKILLLTKSFYPIGTYNLPSGGIHPGETPEVAFLREAKEETCLPVVLQKQIGRIEHHCYYGDIRIDFTSHMMLATPSSETPHPEDKSESISNYMDAGVENIRRFAEHMRTLTDRWLGFGRFRATTLDFVADYMMNSPTLSR